VQVWLSEDLEHINRDRRSGFWSLVVLINSFVNVAFMCCLSAAMYTSVALWQLETFFFYAALSVSFVISYTMDVTNLDIRYPRANELVQMAIRLWAIIVFFAAPDNWTLVGVFAIYLGTSLYINLVLDSFQRRRITSDRIAFSTVHTVFVLLSTALAYGATYFGSVSSKLGGGRPQDAIVTVTPQTRNLIPESVPLTAAGGFTARLVYQTDKYLFVSFADSTLRLRSDDVALIAFKAQPAGTYSDALRKLLGAGITADPPGPVIGQ
jgi:hypothetical protein